MKKTTMRNESAVSKSTSKSELAGALVTEEAAAAAGTSPRSDGDGVRGIVSRGRRGDRQKMAGLALTAVGEGQVECHEIDTDEVDRILARLGLDAGAPKRRDFGRSTTVVFEVSVVGNESQTTLAKLRKILGEKQYLVGPM